MKSKIIILVFFTLFNCDYVTNNKTEKEKIVVKPNGLKTKTNKIKQENFMLYAFLENPIDLKKFKKKNKGYVTTGVIKGKKYYFKPKIKDSIYYCYNFISKDNNQNAINKIIVFKYGKNKHTYEDNTEILIELKIYYQDLNLEKANLIGNSITEIESKFGTNYLKTENKIIYTNKNKILIFELNNSKVKSFRYIKLNTEKIDKDLIYQIINE